MKHKLLVFFSAFLFGAGLEISGMTNPEKVQGFLNVFKNWDPSLILVMAGAIGINIVIHHFVVLKKEKPLFKEKFSLPTKKELSKELIIGSVLFGIGWGLSGFCPGPAISSIYRMQSDVFILIASMLVGMKIFDLYENLTTQ
jgi:uncharacterized membrane protein YedE/YeeE